MGVKGKRGMIGEQVNWIYVLIAGSLILIFFISIALKQKDAAERNAAEESMKNIDSITLQPPRSSQVIHFPNLELQIKCDSSGRVSLEMEKAQPIYPNEPVFGPQMIKGNDLITMTNEWMVPFKATNFIYLTSNETRYIILHGDAQSKSQAEQIFNEMPEQANKKLVQDTAITNLLNTNSKRLVLIGAGIDPVLPSWAGSMNSKDVTALKITIDPVGEVEDSTITGTIIYYTKSSSALSPGTSVTFVGKAMMMGAIYSQNKADYECAMKKAYKRLSAVANIYSRRSSDLASRMAGVQRPDCTGKYSTNEMDILKTAEDPELIKSAKSTIFQQNRDALLASCPTIY